MSWFSGRLVGCLVKLTFLKLTVSSLINLCDGYDGNNFVIHVYIAMRMVLSVIVSSNILEPYPVFTGEEKSLN